MSLLNFISIIIFSHGYEKSLCARVVYKIKPEKRSDTETLGRKGNSEPPITRSMSENRSSRSNSRKNSFSVSHPTSRSGSHSRSNSKSRRHSLTRRRSSHRLIRTISIDSDISRGEDDFALDMGSTGTGSTGTTIAEDSSIVSDIRGLKLESDGGSGRRSAASSLNGPTEVIEVPFVKVTLDSTLPLDYFKDDVLNTAHSLKIPHWYVKGSMGVSPLDREALKLTKITGAMTNVIFKVEYPSLPSLLLRVYGTNNDTIIDRDYELQVLARLSVRNIGPSLYGCFQNGRFEQFLENSVTLGRSDIRDWKTSQRIARRMKELHTGVPLLRIEREQGPACWSKINKWLQTLDDKGSHWVSDDENIKNVLLCHNWSDFKSIVQRYHDWLFIKGPSHVKKSLVFCHNDAQYGNLLFTSPVVKAEEPILSTPRSSSASSLFPINSNVSLDQIIHPTIQDQSQDSKLVVIDFEYAGANPAAFDLANHFSEWMHDYNCSEPFRCNPSNFPSKEQMLNFVYSYVSHLRGNPTSSIDQEVRYYYNAILKWRAVVQLFWCLWAILQSGKLETDMMESEESEGPSGGKYIIKNESPEANGGSVDSDSDGTEGVDVDTFDYLAYCKDKIALFWGDLIKFGIVKEEECTISDIKYLDVQRI